MKAIRTTHKYLNVNCKLLLFLLISVCYKSSAQTYVNGPLAQQNTIGEFYHQNSITLSPGFSANGSNGTFHAFINSSAQIATSFSGDLNYVATWMPRTPVQTPQQLKALEGNNDQVNINVKYFDPLGRTVQSIDKSATPNSADLVQPYEYDDQGRQIKTYLPYAAGDGLSGTYRPSATTIGQPGFYNNAGGTTAQSNTPYAITLYESSPLERVIEKGSPGDNWQLSNSGVANSGHTLKFEYLENNTTPISDAANTRIAVFYTVNIDGNGTRSLVANNIYPASDLFVTVSKDENWTSADGRAGTHEVYTNKEGQTVLKRSFVNNANNGIAILTTYFIYDDFGNLCYTLPPGADPDQPSNSNNTDIINKFCYQYQYDEKQRLIAEKDPGKDWQYTVYNTLNQAVAFQDGNHRTRNEWSIKKYDGVGRLIITGIWNNGNSAISRDDLQGILNQQTVLWEEKVSNGNGYSTSAWPATINTYYAINYYDDYAIPGLPASYNYQAYSGNASGKSDQTSGRLTANKTWLLSNSAAELWTVNYYDNDGRTAQIQSTNHLSGKDIYNNEYTFTDQLISSSHQHISSSQNLLITKRFTYDHHGRPLQQYEKIGNDPEIVLSKREYNELSQLTDKKLHQKTGNARFLQSVDYRYNIGGKLTSINDPNLAASSIFNSDDAGSSDADKFGMAFNYEQATLSQYNGNIGSIQWLSAPVSGASTSINKYDFRYDKLNRLTESVSSVGQDKNKNFDEYLSYDRMGNIKTLGRWAKLSNGRTQIDSLNYNYNGNQVDQIDDNTNNNTYGFAESLNGTVIKQNNEYGYDANGNLNKDLNKGISSITYNNFDLPETITWSDGRVMTYDYDATGNKLKKVFHAGSTTLTTDYVSGFQYEQGQLSFISTEEGIARRNASGNFVYQYALEDQLGNTRVMVQPVFPAETNAEIVQVSNYYPFGLEMKSDDPSSLVSYVNGDKNNYLFNGKEDQLQTGMYDFGARQYDPSTGRWNAPDPAKQFLDNSPYAALTNNPVVNTDPDGRFVPIIAAIAIGAAIGGTANLFTHWNKIKGWKDGFAAFGIGAVAGGIAGATGGAALLAEGGAALTSLAAIGNAAAVGAYSSAAASVAQGIGNFAYFHDPYSSADFVGAAVLGGVTGGILKTAELGIAGKLNSSGAAVSEEPLPMMEVHPDVVGSNNFLSVSSADNAAKEGVQYTKSTLQLGQQMHKAYKIGDVVEGIAMKEFRSIPGIRPDFVDFSTKTIYELKPFNPRAMQQGWNQLNKYQNLFQQKYGGTWKTVLDTY